MQSNAVQCSPDGEPLQLVAVCCVTGDSWLAVLVPVKHSWSQRVMSLLDHNRYQNSTNIIPGCVHTPFSLLIKNYLSFRLKHAIRIVRFEVVWRYFTFAIWQVTRIERLTRVGNILPFTSCYPYKNAICWILEWTCRVSQAVTAEAERHRTQEWNKNKLIFVFESLLYVTNLWQL